jgi:hypothetical protein
LPGSQGQRSGPSSGVLNPRELAIVGLVELENARETMRRLRRQLGPGIVASKLEQVIGSVEVVRANGLSKIERPAKICSGLLDPNTPHCAGKRAIGTNGSGGRPPPSRCRRPTSRSIPATSCSSPTTGGWSTSASPASLKRALGASRRSGRTGRCLRCRREPRGRRGCRGPRSGARPRWCCVDLPQLRADQPAHQPLVAAYAKPWPGRIAVWRSARRGRVRARHHLRHASADRPARR